MERKAEKMSDSLSFAELDWLKFLIIIDCFSIYRSNNQRQYLTINFVCQFPLIERFRAL
jgi:hypothetical protein